MAEPTTPEMEATPDTESANGVGDPAQSLANLLRKLPWHALIGIKYQDPVMSNRQIIQCPLTLTAETLKDVLHKTDLPLTANWLRAICAVRVHHDHVVRPTK